MRSAALRASCAQICSGQKMKGASFRVSAPSEVLNEDSDDADGAEERSYFGEVFARAPVDDFVNSRRIGNAAFRCANVPYNGKFSRAL